MKSNACIICRQSSAKFLFEAKSISYYRCSQCTHVFSTKVLEKPYEDYQHIDKYERWKEYLHNVFARRVADISKYQKKGLALDVGCSLGYFIDALQRQGYKAEGLEPSEDAVSLCVARKLTVYKGYLGDKKLPSSTYDVVVLNHVMEHIRDPRTACTNILKLLRPGGVVFIESPNFASVEAKFSGKNWRYLYPEEHYSQFSPTSLSFLLKDMGFELLSCKTYAAIYDFSDLRIELLRCFKKDPKRLIFYLLEFPLSTIEMLTGTGSAVSCIARKPL